MKFCPNCNHLMRREIANTILFVCGACNTSVEGEGADLSIIAGNLQSTEVREQYNNIIKFAPYDPVNQLVKSDPCSSCGRDYALRLILGTQKIVIFMCRCGRELERKKNTQI